MRHFEDVPEEKDNLGNNPEFVPLDELAEDINLRPDEILMRKEEEENVLANVVDIDNLDNETSNWEDDVENGKYDDFRTQETPVKKGIESNPVSLKERQNIVGIEEMQGREQLHRYWDAPKQKIDNSKQKRPQDNRDSIRFDDAV